MPLGEPPEAVRLQQLPGVELAYKTLHRVYRPRSDSGDERSPWWFASVSEDSDYQGGRFDLAAPNGSCYLALSAVAAVLEAFRDFGKGLLPEEELRPRRRAEVVAPRTAPIAANLADPEARGIAGVTAGLWAGGDEDVDVMAAMRAKTQRWAMALSSAGWRSLHHGIQHDPSGSQRAVTLFDRAGEHLPYDDGAWDLERSDHKLAGDSDLVKALRTYGTHVTRSDVDLPIGGLDEVGDS
jgi:hypothetical protein